MRVLSVSRKGKVFGWRGGSSFWLENITIGKEGQVLLEARAKRLQSLG